jgi:hypothetical protein
VKEALYKMANTRYSYFADSPYYLTPTVNSRLGIMRKRSFPFENDDLEYQIEESYNNRPDLLAHDIYNNANLWWVFAVRNPDTLIDPVYDFITGVTIFVPKITNLQKSLEL